MPFIFPPASSGASQLSDLSDVDTSGVADDQVLRYDEGSGLWLPGDAGSGGGGNASYAETIGDGVTTAFPVEHELDSTDVVVQLWDLTGSDPVLATGDADSVEVTDADTVTVTFSAPPAQDSYRVVVLVSGGSGGGGGTWPDVYGIGFTGQEETRGRNGTGQSSGSFSGQSFNVTINGFGVRLTKILWDVFAADTYEVYFDGDLVDTQVVGGATNEVEFEFNDPLVVIGGIYAVSLVPTTDQRFRFLNGGGSFTDGWATIGTWQEPGGSHGVPVKFVGVPPSFVELV